jgi:hypothetical protein
MTRLEFGKVLVPCALLIRLEKCISLMTLLFISRNQSIRGVKSPRSTSTFVGIEKVGLADRKSARLTWALAGKAAGAIGLAN